MAKLIFYILSFFLMSSLFCQSENPTKAMISGTSGGQAIEQGLSILKSGGSAIDAAIVTALSQIVLCAGSWVSFAGVLNLIYYDAKSNKIYDINGNYNTVLNELDPLTIPKNFNSSHNDYGRTVLVPGFMATIAKAHELFGKIPWHDLFTPAINLAEQGIIWTAALEYMFNVRKNIILRTDEGKKIFLKPDGSNYKIGDNFIQSELASTLLQIANQGPKYMYEGDWAGKSVAEVQKIGGKLNLQDLSNYEPLINEPLAWDSQKRDFTLYSHGGIARGGYDLIQALNLIEESGILDYKQDYSSSSDVLEQMISILNLVELKYFDGGLARQYGLNRTENMIDRVFNKDIWQKVKEGIFSKEGQPIVNLDLNTNMNLKFFPKHSDAVVVFDEEGINLIKDHKILIIKFEVMSLQ